ncbi:hypothetical protein [Flavobacterium litorale]|nr:hypothetical protein [Flavobacterium litorale]
MKKELQTEKVPTINQDRLNLKSDSSKVAKDYRKAFEDNRKFS